MSTFIERRLDDEQKLWDAIPSVPDLQCAWQVLLQCAGPVATTCCAQFHRLCLNFMRRDTTRGCSARWRLCWGHSQAMTPRSRWHATSRASSLRMGRLGLRSGQRLAPAAYWASWADALPMLQQRLPNLTRQVVECLSVEGATCLGDLHVASRTLDRSGFVDRPSREALQRGIRPQPPHSS